MKSKFNPIEVKKRGVMDSHNFNKMNKEIDFDLYNITKNLSESRTHFKDILRNIKTENDILNSRINNLENLISNITAGKKYIDFHTADNINYGEGTEIEIEDYKRASIFHRYSAAIPAFYDSSPKTYLLNNDDEIFIPDDLIITTDNQSVSSNAIDVIENRVENAIDQDIKTAWFKEFIYHQDEDVSEIKVSYEIELPKSIFTNMVSNALLIDPYPNNACNIDKVEYLLINKSDYQEFDNSKINTIDSSNKFLVFEPLNIEKIRITFKTSQPIREFEGKKNYIIGANNISLYNFTFKDESSFIAELNFEDPIQKINSIDFKIKNKNDTDDIEYELYGLNKQNNSTNKINIGELISTNYNQSLLVKINFKSSQFVPSVIENIIVGFE